MKVVIRVGSLILGSMMRRIMLEPLRRISDPTLKLIPVLLLILGLFSALETTGLETSNSSSSRKGGYDPVESYYQLRRHYLTSTSRGDGSSLSTLLIAAPSKRNKNSGGFAETLQHRTSQPSRPFNAHDDNGDGGVYHPNNNPHHHHQHHQLPQAEEDPYETNGHPDRHNNEHRCYVCLPPNKNSREAKDILAMFSPTDQTKIPDCAHFGQHNSHEYDFPCPPTFGGCILRIHGANISRACSRYRLNDCKRANAVEFCYCTQPLCNDIKQEPVRLWPRGPRRQNPGDDDDEDFAASGTSSGDGETAGRTGDEEVAEPPSDSGVLHQYTTTSPEASAPLANSEHQDEIKEISNFSISNQASSCPLSPLVLGAISSLLTLQPHYSYLFS